MIDAIRQWAKQRGNRVYHLGGGLGGSKDSLYEFKAAFSKLRADFYTWRAVVNPDAYHNLVAQWEQRSGAQADETDSYFPAYRKVLEPQPS
jgi:hypothetical protein